MKCGMLLLLANAHTNVIPRDIYSRERTYMETVLKTSLQLHIYEPVSLNFCFMIILQHNASFSDLDFHSRQTELLLQSSQGNICYGVQLKCFAFLELIPVNCEVTIVQLRQPHLCGLCWLVLRCL